MNKKVIALAVAAAAASSSVHALEVYNDGTNTFSVGGRLAASARFSDGDSELRNQSSRINFGYTHALESGWDIGTRAEWAYDALANSGEGSHVSNRLGYITADNEDFGNFTLGKAWSVHYDVTGKTDIFWVYGGDTAGNYDGISGDGGVHGTGRADDVIQYRNNFYGVQVGLQYQFQDSNLSRDEQGNITGGYDRDYGYQAMLGYDFDTGMGIVGVSGVYGETKFDDRADAKVANGVITYENESLYLAANYGQFRNHQTATGDVFGDAKTSGGTNNTIKEATGLELAATYDINQFQLLAGYNQLEDDNTSAKHAYTTLGVAYFTGPVILAAEYQIDASSKNAFGSDAGLDDELALLVRYNF